MTTALPSSAAAGKGRCAWPTGGGTPEGWKRRPSRVRSSLTSATLTPNERRRYELSSGESLELRAAAPLGGLKATLYIKGDVLITEDIENQAALRWHDPAEIGILTIIVKGNIDIAPSVGRIDGLLVGLSLGAGRRQPAPRRADQDLLAGRPGPGRPPDHLRPPAGNKRRLNRREGPLRPEFRRRRPGDELPGGAFDDPSGRGNKLPA